MYSSGYDLKDYYHYIRVPRWLSRFFALPELPAASLRQELSRRGLHQLADDVVGDGVVVPCLSSLPMGWSWSVVLAQLVHERVLSEAVPELHYLHDNKVLEPEGAPEQNRVFAYLGDGGALGRCEEELVTYKV